MPRIPTFESTIAPTAEVGAVKSNIQVSPKDSLAGALVPAANAVTQFYVKEKEISNKVEGGQLIADANQELLEIKEKSKLKSTPEEGVNFFNAGYKQVVDKYKSKANNNYIQKYFELNISSNKPSYVNNILKTTRANMVKTRVSQVSNVVENKILNAVESDNKFDLSTLAESVFNDYQGLVNDGLISEADLQIYRDKLPNLVEVAQVRKIARNNASQAFLILSDVQNFTTIQGDERRKLISEFGTLAKQQADVTSAVLNQSIIEKSKEFMEKYGSKETFGFSTEELEQFKTGDEETDNQIVSLNEKIVNKEFSFDTNYNTNTDVISKIASGEIKNTSTKFLLAGETEAKSILDRAGDKTINNKDVKFLSDVIIRNNNDTFKKQDQQFLKYFENLVPLLQGNTFLNYFDKEYNAKASELRQTLHARYLSGLSQGAEPNDLLSYTSENYIAKDIKNYLPKTSDLGSIIVEMAAENNSTIDGPPRIEGENATEYLKRIENKKNIDVGDENSQDLSASLDKNQDVQQVGFLGDFFLGKDRFLIANWNKHYQTDNSKVNSVKARERLSRDYTVPDEAISAIENAATNFDGDGGFSKEYLIDSLTKIGQIETQYETKIQRGSNPEIENFYARSYWQIEVETAKDLLKNSAPIFGKNFESTFSKYAKNGKTARESLLNLDDKDLVNLLEKDDMLAANIAASLIVTRFNTEEA
jgi:succinate dehydrogenase flavin-adding protein (antitoxin of CptAB toxin-antitoxin module)